MNLQNVLEPAGEQMTLFSLAGSRNCANLTALPESEKGKMMNATCGPKCLEQFEKFSRGGLLAKMFPALLIGMEGWYSMRCKLNWKLRGTKSSRLYFQLQVSTLRTEGIGCGLLPTPQARDEKNGSNITDGRIQRKIQQGWTIDLNDMARSGLLPTPTTQDFKRSGPNSSQQGLPEAAYNGLLPTPTAASDAKGGCTRSDSKRQNDTLAHAMHAATNAPTGTTSQLNPLFVAEMMGFPLNHCDSAYEKIAWDLYMKKKLTKSFQKRILSGATNP